MLEKAGLCSLFIFSAAGLVNFSIALTGFVLMTVAALVLYRPRFSASVKDPVLLFPMAFFLYVIAIGLLKYMDTPDRSEVITDWTIYYAVASGFPAYIVALWLGADRTRIVWVMHTVFFVLLVVILCHFGAEQVRWYLNGNRAFFGFGNAAGLYIASAMSGILIFGLGITPATFRGLAVRYFLAIIYLVVAMGVFSLAFVWHQNRSALLATMMVFPVVLVWLVSAHLKASGKKGSHTPLLFIVVLLLCLGGAFLLSGKDVKQRLYEGYENTRQAFSMDIEKLPDSPTSKRINFWREGFISAAERPLLGRGPGSVPEVFQHRPSLAHYSHMHNLYVQLVVETGFVGLFLYCLAIIAILRSSFRAYKSGQMPGDIYYFVSASFALFLLINMTQIRIDGSHAMFYITLLCGISMTYGVKNNERRLKGEPIQ